MKSRGSLPPADVDTSGVGVPSSDVESLIAAGRHEAPAFDLEQRVHDAVAYRHVLADARPPWLRNVVNSRSNRFAVAVAALAVTAGALLWSRAALRRITPAIAPEPLAANSLQTSSIAAAAAPIADPCLKRAVASGREPLIDDFEDGDDEILALEGRAGLWRWARDTDAPNSAPALLPIPRDTRRNRNQMALHVKGGRLQDWGTIVEFNFIPACYDASAYTGLAFQAKGSGRIFVAPREVGTIPRAEGGTCSSDCYNPHVKKVELDSRWRSFRVDWNEVQQRGYGRPPFDPKQLHSIAFLIRPEDTPYDFWVDDVSFVKR